MTLVELRRAAPFLLVPLLLLVTGCGLLPWELPGVEPIAPPGGAVRAELEASRAAWVEAGIDDYELGLTYGCFCPPHEAVRVTVVDGLVESVLLPDGSPAGDWYRSFPLTMDALYDEAAEALDRGGTATIEYRADGLPASLALDPIPEAADDELGITVLEFIPAG